MQAAIYRGPGDIRIEERPDPKIEEPTDAIVRVTHTAICGSDLWFYRGEEEHEEGAPVGHEPMGIVEEVGEAVRHVEPGDRVFAPFAFSGGECEFCRKGLQTSCLHGGVFRPPEWVRRTSRETSSAPRQRHARSRPRSVRERRGRPRIAPATDGRHGDRSSRRLSAGVEAGDTAAIGYVGVPHVESAQFVRPLFYKNASFTGGPAPVRNYAEELVADVLRGTLDPSPIFTQTVDLDGVPEGYEAMDEREAVKVVVELDE